MRKRRKNMTVYVLTKTVDYETYKQFIAVSADRDDLQGYVRISEDKFPDEKIYELLEKGRARHGDVTFNILKEEVFF